MAIEKNLSLVLSTMPYRESSVVMHLFTLQSGRIHVLAKGIRKGDRRSVPVERGHLIEHMTYLKPHRDLQQITECHLREHYPAIRCSLEKTAVRDMLFDILLAAVRIGGDPHPDLFTFITGFLATLDRLPEDPGLLLIHLSKSLFGVSAHLGFYLDFRRCARCGTAIGPAETVEIDIEEGAMRCGSCGSHRDGKGRLLPAPIAGLLRAPGGEADIGVAELTTGALMNMVRLSSDYCRYHLDIRRKPDSLAFLEQLFTGAGALPQKRVKTRT